MTNEEVAQSFDVVWTGTVERRDSVISRETEEAAYRRRILRTTDPETVRWQRARRWLDERGLA